MPISSSSTYDGEEIAEEDGGRWYEIALLFGPQDQSKALYVNGRFISRILSVARGHKNVKTRASPRHEAGRKKGSGEICRSLVGI